MGDFLFVLQLLDYLSIGRNTDYTLNTPTTCWSRTLVFSRHSFHGILVLAPICQMKLHIMKKIHKRNGASTWQGSGR